MKTFSSLIQPIFKNNKWLISKTFEILDYVSFRTLANISLYVVIVDKIHLKTTMVYNHTSSFYQKNRVDTDILI